MKESQTNLGLLMATFRLTSRSLAEMLNVHYSLVSKWLNNKRPLRLNSEYLKQITEIALDIDKPNQYAVIKSLLIDAYPSANLSKRENLAIYLGYFLSTDAPPAVEIGHWDMPDRSKIDRKFKVDVYLTEKGRQNALLRMVDSILALSPNQEMLLYGRESMNWQMEYPEFQQLWLQKHMEMLRRGNKLTIMHTVDRPPEELVFSLTHWIPLHLTRKTEAYYLQDYAENAIKASITILRGRAALAGLSVDGLSSGMATYYTTDAGVVKRMEDFYYGMLRNGAPLFLTPEGEEVTPVSLDMSNRKCNSFVYSSLPLQYGLSSADFAHFLEENGVESEVYANCMIFFERDKSALLSVLDSKETHVFLLKETLEKGLGEGVYVSGFNWLAGGRRLVVTPSMMRKALRGYCETLERYENFSVALLDEPPLTYMPLTSLIVKENVAVLANAIWPDVPGPLFIREPTIIMAFYKYFEKFWRTTPKISRDKKFTINRLLDLANSQK